MPEKKNRVLSAPYSFAVIHEENGLKASICTALRQENVFFVPGGFNPITITALLFAALGLLITVATS